MQHFGRIPMNIYLMQYSEVVLNIFLAGFLSVGARKRIYNINNPMII